LPSVLGTQFHRCGDQVWHFAGMEKTHQLSYILTTDIYGT